MHQGYDALRRGAAWMKLSARGRIAVRGRDRARLLHNLTSNEVKKLGRGSGCYAFLLSPQGRIQADLTLLVFDDHILLDTEPELREKIVQHIRRYIVADQVEFEDVTAATCASRARRSRIRRGFGEGRRRRAWREITSMCLGERRPSRASA